jgi:hypothetical protein
VLRVRGSVLWWPRPSWRKLPAWADAAWGKCVDHYQNDAGGAKGMDLGVILAIIGIVAAIAVPLSIELLKRPRLKIVPTRWSPGGPVEWTFAVVQVLNKPLTGPIARLLSRQAAQGCVVDIDYFSWGLDEKLMPTVRGRWSSHPEPLRSVPAPSAETPRGTGGAISPVASAFPMRAAPQALIPVVAPASPMRAAPQALIPAVAPASPMRAAPQALIPAVAPQSHMPGALGATL